MRRERESIKEAKRSAKAMEVTHEWTYRSAVKLERLLPQDLVFGVQKFRGSHADVC